MTRLPLFDKKGPLTLADLRRLADEAESERDAQRRLIAELNNPLLTMGPVLAFAVPNGVPLCGLSPKRRAQVWESMRRDGAREGATDLIILHKGTTRYVEMKRAKGGRLSEDQGRFRDDVRAAGGIWVQLSGYQEAVEYLTTHGILRRHS
jgi:hypothetical protein